MTSKTASQALLTGLVCALGFATAFAGPRQGDCDVVSLAGSGTRLDDGVIVGSSTLQGNTLDLNSAGKLCKCNLSGNN